MNTTVEHSPLPWVAVESRDTIMRANWCLDMGGDICQIDQSDAIGKADAALIVTAVNSHAALVESNARLVAALECLAYVPIEEFGHENKPDLPLIGWNNHQIFVRDVLKAREALSMARKG